VAILPDPHDHDAHRLDGLRHVEGMESPGLERRHLNLISTF
jgi:hypothetical protein